MLWRVRLKINIVSSLWSHFVIGQTFYQQHKDWSFFTIQDVSWSLSLIPLILKGSITQIIIKLLNPYQIQQQDRLNQQGNWEDIFYMHRKHSLFTILPTTTSTPLLLLIWYYQCLETLEDTEMVSMKVLTSEMNDPSSFSNLTS